MANFLQFNRELSMNYEQDVKNVKVICGNPFINSYEFNNKAWNITLYFDKVKASNNILSPSIEIRSPVAAFQLPSGHDYAHSSENLITRSNTYSDW